MVCVITACTSALTLTLAMMFTAIIKTATGLDLTPRYNHNEFTSCITKTGGSGKCVDWSYCNEKHEIEIGGVISDSELRSGECPKIGDWCCAEKNITKPPPPKPRVTSSRTSCIFTERPVCPWCVKLYRDGKDRRRLESGFFCMGTLIGTRVVLTTGTCMIQAKLQNLWAQVPASPKPNTNYTVKFRLIHPEYNSGTRENDLALFTIDPEPDWGESGAMGACLGLETNSLVGECIAAGIDEDENIKMTPLIVTSGNCGRGSATDSSCGHAIGEDCSIFVGSPIMCRPNDGPFMMMGLAKLPCTEDPPQALLNNLVKAKNWLIDRLKGTMGLIENDFIKSTIA